jgi:hypothetical protein
VEVGDIQVAIRQDLDASHEAQVGTSILNNRAVGGAELDSLPRPGHLCSKALS